MFAKKKRPTVLDIPTSNDWLFLSFKKNNFYFNEYIWKTQITMPELKHKYRKI